MQTTQEYTHIQAQIMQVMKHATHSHPCEHKHVFILAHTISEVNIYKTKGGGTAMS